MAHDETLADPMRIVRNEPNPEIQASGREFPLMASRAGLALRTAILPSAVAPRAVGIRARDPFRSSVDII
jgi:hypothetical protein